MKNASLILFVLSVSSCVHIRDSEWIADLGELGAKGFHTLRDETRDLTKEEWDIERFGMVCTKPDSFADFKAAIIKLCRYSARCSWDDKKKIKAFFKVIKEHQQTIEIMKAAVN